MPVAAATARPAQQPYYGTAQELRLSCHKTRFNGNKWKRESYEESVKKFS